MGYFLPRNNLREIPDVLCAKTMWYDGELAAGCDALLCPVSVRWYNIDRLSTSPHS